MVFKKDNSLWIVVKKCFEKIGLGGFFRGLMFFAMKRLTVGKTFEFQS